MNTFNASSLSREGFPNKFKAYLSLSLEVVGVRENGRARETRAPFFTCAHYLQAPATQATSKIAKTVIGT